MLQLDIVAALSREPMTRPARLPLAMLLAALVFGAAFDGPHASELEPAALAELFPGADAVGVFEGEPPAAAVSVDGELAGYVFSTFEVIGSVGYSGKPLDVLVGLDLAGTITGARVREHHEPILIIGVADEDLHAFAARYVGIDIRDVVAIGRAAPADAVSVDAISGASVSSIVMNDAILRSARTVARSRGVLSGEGIDIDGFEPMAWGALLTEGSIAQRAWSNRDADPMLADGANIMGIDPDGLFVELLAALATPARIGRNLLGQQNYNRLMAELTDGAQAVFVAARGRYSFKGTDYKKTGRFERIQIVQDDKTIALTEPMHQRIDVVATAEAPELREAALFVLPAEVGFDPARPWRLDLLVAAAPGSDAPPSIHSLEYELPALYFTATQDNAALVPGVPVWQEIWTGRPVSIGILVALLAIVAAVLVFQDALVRRRGLYVWLRTGILAFTVVWLGWCVGAQLSVVNVVTFLQSLLTGFSWDFFLLDPLMFILWGFVAVGMLFLGRGVFCGWLCPFGALQELTNQAARLLKVPQIRMPWGLHERLWPIKYVLFFGLLAVSLHSLELTVLGAEIEPFKTAIVLRFIRGWEFLAWPIGLLAVGLFIERFYCRYLCPLGAALALPGRARMFDWLKRKPQCGTECQVCAVRCTVQAIHPEGKIHPNECIHCLNCQVLYNDDRLCLPLVHKRKRREDRAKKAVAAKEAREKREAAESG